MTTILRYRNILRPYVRELRNKMTIAEKKLWYKIRRKSLYGVQFCRQMPIESYIVDFYAKEIKLAIEVDGPIHDSTQAVNSDSNRDFVLTNLRITVLRFTNNQILFDIETVISIIKCAILKKQPL